MEIKQLKDIIKIWVNARGITNGELEVNAIEYLEGTDLDKLIEFIKNYNLNDDTILNEILFKLNNYTNITSSKFEELNNIINNIILLVIQNELSIKNNSLSLEEIIKMITNSVIKTEVNFIELKSNLLNTNNIVSNIQNDIIDVQSNIDSIGVKTNTITNTIENVQSDVNLIDVKTNNITNKIGDVQSNINSIDVRTNNITNKIEDVKSNVNFIGIKTDNLNNKLNNVKLNIDSLNLKDDIIINKVDNLKSNINLIDIKSDNITNKIDNVKDDINKIDFEANLITNKVDNGVSDVRKIISNEGNNINKTLKKLVEKVEPRIIVKKEIEYQNRYIEIETTKYIYVQNKEDVKPTKIKKIDRGFINPKPSKYVDTSWKHFFNSWLIKQNNNTFYFKMDSQSDSQMIRKEEFMKKYGNGEIGVKLLEMGIITKEKAIETGSVYSSDSEVIPKGANPNKWKWLDRLC